MLIAAQHALALKHENILPLLMLLRFLYSKPTCIFISFLFDFVACTLKATYRQLSLDPVKFAQEMAFHFHELPSLSSPLTFLHLNLEQIF